MNLSLGGGYINKMKRNHINQQNKFRSIRNSAHCDEFIDSANYMKFESNTRPQTRELLSNTAKKLCEVNF